MADVTKTTKFWRARTYFFRGHNAWFQFFLAMFNFLVIQYQLFIVGFNLEWLVANSFLVFSVSFMTVYMSISVLVGRWDYKRGSYKMDATIQTLANPPIKELIEDVKEIKTLLKEKEKD
jgi:hypothetical protein